MFEPYALTVNHEAGDSTLQILFGDVVLATVSEPCGPGDKSKYCVWKGTGLDDEDEEMEPVMTFRTVDFLDDSADKMVERCWRAAVRSAYFVAQQEWSLLP